MTDEMTKTEIHNDNSEANINEPDINDARDWQGNAVRCETCPHRKLLAESKCRMRLACIADRYARRIDRFFDWNPELANGALNHPYFEVRAVAAKHADVVQLPALLNDPDETVRWSAALRLPQEFLFRMIHDSHREVRIRVASRLDSADLILIMKDPDYYVRQIVARRLPQHLLRLMIRDGDPEVRRVIAGRIDPAWIAPLTHDPEGSVRLRAVERLFPSELIQFDCDPDWRVRHEVARRMRIDLLGAMLHDSDPLVREMARSRLEPDKATAKTPANQQKEAEQ
jgi:hypothetical protein